MKKKIAALLLAGALAVAPSYAVMAENASATEAPAEEKKEYNRNCKASAALSDLRYTSKIPCGIPSLRVRLYRKNSDSAKRCNNRIHIGSDCCSYSRLRIFPSRRPARDFRPIRGSVLPPRN